jgi:hypothetical protein
MHGRISGRGSYPVHKGHAVHKCTKRNLAVRLPSNSRRKYADEPSRSLRSLPSLFCEKPPAPSCRWMENRRSDFVLCICARRDPCALDTIPSGRAYEIGCRRKGEPAEETKQPAEEGDGNGYERRECCMSSLASICSAEICSTYFRVRNENCEETIS